MTATPAQPKILLVSHNFPPTLGPESSLVKINALDLHRRGWAVSVLTTTMEHMHQGLDFQMMEGLPEDIEIIRTPSYDALFRKEWPILSRLLIPILRRWILPEIFLFWLFSAVPAGRKWLSDNPSAIIYSRATKYVSNVCAWYLRRTSRLPWIAHISDPWVGPPLNCFQQWFARRLESRVFRDADAVVIVSAKLADHILRLYPWGRAKVRVIPHGYAPLAKPSLKVKGAGTRSLHAIQAGSFLPGYREPGNLFAGLALLNERRPLVGRFKVTLVGEDTVRYQDVVNSLGLDLVIELLPSVPYNECQVMVDRSDLLLVLDTPGFGGIFLPTKLIEYLPYSKPILGLAESGSTIEGILHECGLECIDQNDPVQIANGFDRLLTLWESGHWEVPECFHEVAARYRIERLNDSLDELLHSLRNLDINKT